MEIVNRVGGVVQVVEHLPTSMRPWVQTPKLSKKEKKKMNGNMYYIIVW
jgi:hypothetical protein